MLKRLLVGKKAEAEENMPDTVHYGLCYINKVNIRMFNLIVHFDENWHQQISCCMTYVGCIYIM